MKFCFAQPEDVATREARSFLLARHRREALHYRYSFRLSHQARQSGDARLSADEHLHPAGVTDDVGFALLAAPDPERNEAEGAGKRSRSRYKRGHELTESFNPPAQKSIVSRILQLLTLGNMLRKA